MPYDKTEIYQPSGRTLTEAEYNAVMLELGGHSAVIDQAEYKEAMDGMPKTYQEEAADLSHQLKLKANNVDSALFYLKYLEDDLRSLADQFDDVEHHKQARRLVHETQRIAFKLAGKKLGENRACERLDRGTWCEIEAGIYRRVLRCDQVLFRHWFNQEHGTDLWCHIEDISKDGKQINIRYSIGEHDNVDDYNRWIGWDEVKQYREWDGQ